MSFANKSKTSIDFNNLVSKRKFISQEAWKKTSIIISKSQPKLGNIEIITGPNTNPWSKNLEKALELTSRTFPNFKEPAKVIVLRFNFTDLDWAKNQLKLKVSTEAYARMEQEEGNRLIDSGCSYELKNCQGSKQVTTFEGDAVLILGVPNQIPVNNEERFTTGMLESHEYFHAMQRLLLRNLDDKKYLWPPRWFIEGSAEWVQNAAINYENFKKYRSYIKNECNSDQACRTITLDKLNDYLSQSKDGNGMSKYDEQFAYSLGSKFVEALVAASGVDSLLKVWNVSSTGIGWEKVFKEVYGSDWNSTYPKIARATLLNIKNAS